MLCYFVIKQRTAYDRRISDGSSDVCSSDLYRCRIPGRAQVGGDSVRKEININHAVVLAAVATAVLYGRRHFHRRGFSGAGGDWIGRLVVNDFGLGLATSRQGNASCGSERKNHIWFHDPSLFALGAPGVNVFLTYFAEKTAIRSEERRFGKEGVSEGRCRW